MCKSFANPFSIDDGRYASFGHVQVLRQSICGHIQIIKEFFLQNFAGVDWLYEKGLNLSAMLKNC